MNESVREVTGKSIMNSDSVSFGVYKGIPRRRSLKEEYRSTFTTITIITAWNCISKILVVCFLESTLTVYESYGFKLILFW